MINFRDQNILSLSPHSDDSELSAGGTIARAVQDGGIVDVASFSVASLSGGAKGSRPVFEQDKACSILGVNQIIHTNYGVRKLDQSRQQILDFLYSEKDYYDIILCPSLTDTHQDHETVAREAIRAFKHNIILAYDVPWNSTEFRPNLFVSLSKDLVDKKWQAVSQYLSQTHRPYFCEDYIYSWAKMRGVQAGCDYAEAFELVRGVV